MELTLINKLNPSHLRVFEAAYRLKSMTLAAQELFLTQSGVSQHIKHLEEQLGVTLFVRSRSGFYRTETADTLYKGYFFSFAKLNETLEQIKNTKSEQAEGVIRIGVPTEFGNNIVIPAVSKWLKKFPKIKLDVTYGYGKYLTSQVEEEKLDFAFVDSVQRTKRLNAKVIFQESLSLVCGISYLKEKKYIQRTSKAEQLNELAKLEFLDYEYNDSILRMWFKFHFQKRNLNINIRAWAMNVQGIASLIRQDMGAAILPDHVILQLNKQNQGTITILPGRKNKGLRNEISVVWAKGKPLSTPVATLLDHVVERGF